MSDETAHVRYPVGDVDATSAGQILLEDPSGNPIELFQPR